MESESLLRLRMVPLCHLSRRRNTADGTALRRKCGDARGLGQSGSSLRLRRPLHGGGGGLVTYRRWGERLARHENWRRCSALNRVGVGASHILLLRLLLWLLLRRLGVTPLRTLPLQRAQLFFERRDACGLCGLWVLRLRCRLWLLLRWLGVTPLRCRTGVVLRLCGVAGCGLWWVLRLWLLLRLRHERLFQHGRNAWVKGGTAHVRPGERLQVGVARGTDNVPVPGRMREHRPAQTAGRARNLARDPARRPVREHRGPAQAGRKHEISG